MRTDIDHFSPEKQRAVVGDLPELTIEIDGALVVLRDADDRTRRDSVQMIREASVLDAPGMIEVLGELVAAGKRRNRSDESFVLSHYIEHPHRLHCLLALDCDGTVLGFQSLKRAHEANPYGTREGWGIIGTHIRPSAARRGVGSQLFNATLASSNDAELPAIEAYIGRDNAAALAFYERLGFRYYRETEAAIGKVYAVMPMITSSIRVD